MAQNDDPRGVQHRAEPEIIPPDRHPAGSPRTWTWTSDGTSYRVRIRRFGPFGAILTALLVGAVLAVVLALLAGAFLIGAILVGLVAAAAIVSALLRNLFRSAP